MDSIKIFDINQCLSFVSICSSCNQFRELLESKRTVGIRSQANAGGRIFDIRIKATPIGMAPIMVTPSLILQRNISGGHTVKVWMHF